jgi:hypothetical protein
MHVVFFSMLFYFIFFKRIIQICTKFFFVLWNYSNFYCKIFPLYILTIIPLFQWFSNHQTGVPTGTNYPQVAGP